MHHCNSNNGIASSRRVVFPTADAPTLTPHHQNLKGSSFAPPPSYSFVRRFPAAGVAAETTIERARGNRDSDSDATAIALARIHSRPPRIRSAIAPATEGRDLKGRASNRQGALGRNGHPARTQPPPRPWFTCHYHYLHWEIKAFPPPTWRIHTAHCGKCPRRSPFCSARAIFTVSFSSYRIFSESYRIFPEWIFRFGVC